MQIELAHVLAALGALVAAIGVLWKCYLAARDRVVAILAASEARLLNEVAELKLQITRAHATTAVLLAQMDHLDDPQISSITERLFGGAGGPGNP